MKKYYWVAKLNKGYFKLGSKDYVDISDASKRNIEESKEQVEKYFKRYINEDFRVVKIEIEYKIAE